MLMAVAEKKDSEKKESEWARAMAAALNEAVGPEHGKKKWLAEQIEVDPSTVSRILGGTQAPSLDQLSRIARALGVTRRSLLARAGYLDAEGDATIDVDALPPNVRDMVLAMVRVPREGQVE
jgi:hypothetical protein